MYGNSLRVSVCGLSPLGGMSPLERKARRWSVTSVLKKLLTDGWPARSTWSSLPSCLTLHRPQTRIGYLVPSSLVGSSNTVENTLASVFESTPVQRALTPIWSEVKFLSPSGLYRFLIPSKS